MDNRLILSCHDCSEGGIGVALAEMAFAGEVGATVTLDTVPHESDMREDHILFSESNSRFIIEVETANKESVSEILKNVPFAWFGETTDSQRLIINNTEKTLVDEDIFDLKAVWQAPLKTV
jgi:phosphoribosylformylglycinamidine synthase